MGARVLQNSFLGGVISPSMFGRVDDPYYAMGAYDLKNFIVLPQGALRSRSGFQYVTKAKNSDKAVRLIPFRFASDQTLVLVFGDKTLRIVTQGKVLLNDDNEIFEIKTPYKAEDLFSLNYCQNADIITITSVKYPPKELRRYGATDWRFTDVSTAPTITPPTNITLTASYPSGTEGKDKEKITAKYKITSIDENGKESLPSEIQQVKCNYYITGGTVTISWLKVTGAKRYRVYRDVAGIFGFIGETDGLSIVDIGDNPDGSMTPPNYSRPFLSQNGIKYVEVVNGGSGYNENYTSSLPTKITLPPFYCYAEMSHDHTYGYSDNGNPRIYIDIFDGDTFEVKKTIKIPLDLLGFTREGDYHYDFKFILIPRGMNKEGLTINIGQLNINNPRIKINRFFSATNKYPASGRYIYRYSVKKIGYFGGVSANGELIGETNLTVGENCSVYPVNNFLNNYDCVTWNKTQFTKESFTRTIGSLTLKTLQTFQRIFNSDTNFLSLDDLLTLNEVGFDNDTVENTTIKITDKTGSGAVLNPIIKDGVIIEVQVVQTGSNYTNPTLTVLSDTGSGAVLKAIVDTETNNLDYPSAITQFDQRRVFAGSVKNPLKVWLTNAGYQDLMMYHYPINDDDRIEIDAVASDADRIKHAVALDNLILLTGSSELRVYTQNSDALTPKSIAVKALSYNGANDVQPVIANSTVVYCASRSNHALALTYAYQQGGMASFDLSLRASHLFDSNQIKDLTLSKAPLQLAWFVSSNGKLLGLTFYPDQSIQAWHVHETDGIIESCCAVSEGEEDHLYIVVKRLINGKYLRYIERLTNINIKDKEPINLDSFIQSNNSSFTSVLNLEDESKINTRGYSITGLEHLEGKTVTAIIDDNIEENLVVKNGSITVKNLGQNIAVGIPYSSSLITIPFSANTQGNLQGSVKTVSQLGVRTSYQGELFASIFPYGKEYKIKRDSNNFNNQDKQSKVSLINIPTAWDLQGQLKLTHKDVHTVEIQALIANISIEGAK